MKKTLFLLTVLFCSHILQAQFEFIGGYSLTLPSGKLNENINLTHSGTLQGNFHLPFAKKLWVGVQAGFGGYAYKTERQFYQFDNGFTTETDVRFSSNVLNGHAVIGYNFFEGGKIVPYITARAGATNFFTNIFIEDPHDFDGCRPLENRNVFGDVSFSGGVGIGAKLDGRNLFKSRDKNWAIDISVNYLSGATMDYLNVRKLQSSVPQPDDPKKDFMVKFINVSTSEIHEHKVAQVFTSSLKQVDIRIGYLYRF
jgi:hypothetical protein